MLLLVSLLTVGRIIVVVGQLAFDEMTWRTFESVISRAEEGGVVTLFLRRRALSQTGETPKWSIFRTVISLCMFFSLSDPSTPRTWKLVENP